MSKSAGIQGGSILFEDEKFRPDESHQSTAPFHHMARSKRRQNYKGEQVRQVQMLYIAAAILWIVLIFIGGFYETDIVGWVILAIPLAVYAINFSNTCNITKEVENEMFQGNFLSFAFLVVVILINWAKAEDKGKFYRVLIVALILITLSLVDIWMGPKQMVFSRHFRTILQTAALVLLVFVLYIYYTDAIMVVSTK